VKRCECDRCRAWRRGEQDGREGRRAVWDDPVDLPMDLVPAWQEGWRVGTMARRPDLVPAVVREARSA
jgi:hypothetical protein